MDLKTYLKKNKIKLRVFSEKVNAKESHLSSICNRKRFPSPGLALEIEKATKGKVSIYDLLYPR